MYQYTCNSSVTVPSCRFVAADLASVDRSRTPWLVVGGHRPMYVDSTYVGGPDGDLPVAADLVAAFEELFFVHQARPASMLYLW